MPTNKSGARYNPSRSFQKCYSCDYGRSQSVTEGQGSVNGFQTDKSCHFEADNTVLPSNRADTATRSLSGHIKSHPECLNQFIAAQRVPDPCRSVGKWHKSLPDCEKIPGPSQSLQVTKWMASIDEKKHYAFIRRMGEKNPPPPKEVSKTAPVARSRNSNMEKQPQAQNKGKGKAPATKPDSQGYRIPNIQQDAIRSVFQMARTMMEFQKKEEARLQYRK
ncbi:hypothetical protein O181_035899 [Austropuccinia psidii MF-1]|uniref:Uncharacterized protein n=1 Tax=Austropuccinia psidii MF-1 TaxID=1389203 RepID=A0A9Q3D3M3_9BASI|nr:hypothetical protein [Austropuccinia psidii MF-1]